MLILRFFSLGYIDPDTRKLSNILSSSLFVFGLSMLILNFFDKEYFTKGGAFTPFALFYFISIPFLTFLYSARDRRILSTPIYFHNSTSAEYLIFLLVNLIENRHKDQLLLGGYLRQELSSEQDSSIARDLFIAIGDEEINWYKFLKNLLEILKSKFPKKKIFSLATAEINLKKLGNRWEALFELMEINKLNYIGYEAATIFKLKQVKKLFYFFR